MIINDRRSKAKNDWFLIVLVLCMCIFGIYAVAIATYSTTSTATSILGHITESSYAVRQCIFCLAAPFIMWGLNKLINPTFLRRFASRLYFASVALVAIVFVFNRATGVKQWLDIIWGFTIQPTEFAKLALILMLAKQFSDEPDKPLSWKSLLLICVPALIVLASGEMGSVLVMFVIFAVMLWFTDYPRKWYLLLVLLAVAGVAAIYAYAVAFKPDSYRLQRILAFIDPSEYALDDAYQQQQSQKAVGSGGLTGIGQFVDGSMSQLNYVPADWTDFIFSTIGESFGFIGCCVLLVAYIAIIVRMIYLAYHTADAFGMQVIIGVTAMVFFHVFENIGMNIGVTPIAGIPLPFLSYGGSNMMTNIAGVGLVLCVTSHRSAATQYSTLRTTHNKYWQRH